MGQHTKQSNNHRLEKLIHLVDQEERGGRLAKEQKQAIVNKTLEPLTGNEKGMFMLGGSISENTALACCQNLVDEMGKHVAEGSHVLKVMESIIPASIKQKE